MAACANINLACIGGDLLPIGLLHLSLGGGGGLHPRRRYVVVTSSRIDTMRWDATNSVQKRWEFPVAVTLLNLIFCFSPCK